MLLTKDSIASSGVLIAKKILDFPYDHVFVYGCFRIFYTLDGGVNSPKDLTDRNDDGVPDYIESMIYKLETARLLLTESCHLKDPLASGFFHGKGAKYFDVYIRDIPKENGIASSTIYNDKHEILAGSPFEGMSLKISLHRNLIPKTGTPLHELFHVFQYNYSQFNNPWFMEGLGRWSQRIITESSGKEETLPSSISELNELLNKSHEAEYFWNRLSSLCDDRGTFVIPNQLRKNDEIANNIRPGAKLIKAVLENTEQECRLIQGKTRSKILAGLAYWPREEKKSPDNNKHIFRAIYNAIDSCTDVRRDELAHFINTILPLINQTSADFDTPAIQNFMLALGKCSGEYVKADMNGILYSDHFDLFTRTLSMHTLDCSNPQLTDADLETFNVLKHVNGNLELRNSNITHLDGFCNIESIKGNFVLGNSGIENISGLSKLRTVNGIELNGMKSLLRISGFNSLKAVSNNINISNNKNLVCINGFNSLEDNGSLEIIENSSLTSISAFNRLLNLNGDLLISKCKKLETLSGLSALRTVKNISINETFLADLSNLRNLFGSQKDFPGYIKIISNRVNSISFISGLRSVASSFYLHQNRLANLKGLEALESVGASFSLGSNRLNDISQLSNLNKINGALSLSDNRLSSLHGLENLRNVKTTTWNGTPLTIKFQDNLHPDGNISLTDISALANVKEVGGHLIIHIDPNHNYDFLPPNGSAYRSNKITYCANQKNEAGKVELSSVEVQAVAQTTPEEIKIEQNDEPFLAWEPAQPKRYEFVNGKVIALGEPTCRQVTMSLNIAAWLTNHFRISRFRIHMAHMKLYVESARAFLYPDIFVTCSEAAQQPESCMKNPLLIVEVLSDASQAYDRGEKFSHYRKIPTLREYVLIDPDTLRVEIFRKNVAGRWELHDLPHRASLELESLELSVPATVLYAYI